MVRRLIIYQVVGLGLVCGCPALVQAATSLDALIQQSRVEAQKTQSGMYKVYVEVEGDVVVVIAEEGKLGSSTVKVVNLYASVVTFPENYQPSQALLRKMLDLNDHLNFGKLYRENNFIFYRSTTLLQSAGPESFQTELGIAHVLRGILKKELQPFVTE